MVVNLIHQAISATHPMCDNDRLLLLDVVTSIGYVTFVQHTYLVRLVESKTALAVIPVFYATNNQLTNEAGAYYPRLCQQIKILSHYRLSIAQLKEL